MIMIINRNKLVKLCLNYENITCLHISHFKMIFSSRYDYYHFENFSRTNFSVNSGQVSKNFIINLFFFSKTILYLHHSSHQTTLLLSLFLESKRERERKKNLRMKFVLWTSKRKKFLALFISNTHTHTLIES